MMTGFWFNGKHTWKDFKLGINDREIGNPNKRKVKHTPPFSNREIDFSELYGGQVYSPRTLRYELNIISDSNLYMNITKTKIINWLLNSEGQKRLFDDELPNYYFLAEVENGPEFQKSWRKGGPLVVEFIAYPFMIHELPEGNDIWDTFNFELDVAQQTNFDVNGTKDIVLINSGTPDVVPKITSNSSFSIISHGKRIVVSPGTTESARFVLKSGENHLRLEGDGHIEFEFYQELI